MNAARALLLPRGSPRRRMPLWLQRLKALDLLQAVQEFPSFPILVETYRDVLQDAFDMPALAKLLDDIATDRVAIRTVETDFPSPFAASLQFGFVQDWLYADDAPRAERRAALLSLDRALLDELLGGEGADASTIAMLESILARRRGTAPGTRARTADELAALIDRAGDLSVDEVRGRVASPDEGPRGDPFAELLDRGRAIAIDVPTVSGAERRVILTETYARYAAVIPSNARDLQFVYAGPSLSQFATDDIVPAAFRAVALTRPAARREMLVRYLSLAGAVSIDDIRARYDFDEAWIRQRLDEWTRAGKLVRGTFGGDRTTPRWASRRLLEQARRRELAQARKQIEAVSLPRFARFMQRWQHVAPWARLTSDEGTIAVARQMYGLARPAEQWEREYFPARVDAYDPAALSRLIASGELVWIGGSAGAPDEPSNLSSVRFVRRGTARLWISADDPPPLSDVARQTLDALERDGASFFEELASSTSLTPRTLRDALRELAGAGLVTNDTIESLRQVVRWRPLISPRDRAQPDPTRWLPADFTPSANRHIVQRRPNLRRLPRWKRPDKSPPESSTWPGRWSLVRTPRVLGPEADEAAQAELIARQWLDRYGIVAREIWRREKPPISWRSIYFELKRLEFRGDIRRGYFVRGLSGAQFALPEAIEMLRSAPDATDAEPVVMTATDPANVYSLPLVDDEMRDAFVRGHTRGALIVTVDGVAILIAERRGERVTIRADASEASVGAAVNAFAAHLLSRVKRDLAVETINGQPAGGSRYLDAFVAAGFRRATSGLRYYRSV
jgi:ATP-dependent Lhr-like helicase